MTFGTPNCIAPAAVSASSWTKATKTKSSLDVFRQHTGGPGRPSNEGSEDDEAETEVTNDETSDTSSDEVSGIDNISKSGWNEP